MPLYPDSVAKCHACGVDAKAGEEGGGIFTRAEL